MDEMKIKLSTNFMRCIISKIAAKVIANKLGVKADIQINGISLEKVNDKMHVHLDVDADINEKDLLKVTRLANMEEEL